MADTSHLEKMGRELKCPICLSLFDSAVSLTCNHVFCNSCIRKSMRSGSSCPVCKVPYQHREIRPAPHMDNLVNIYKSMEVASGLNLFVSQNGPSTKLAEMQTGQTTPEVVKFQKMKGASPTSSKPKSKSSGRNRRKSSFPTNKRVQVPQSPDTETPLRQEKDIIDQHQLVKKNCSAFHCEHPLSTVKENQHMSPFFWVREEDERSSQQTDVDQLTCTPAKVPSFSDLKDSDDDKSPEISMEEKMHSKRNVDFFDSEMFEWTQKACSPELCSSPFKKQVQDTEGDEMLGQKLEGVSIDGTANKELNIEQQGNVSSQEKNDITNDELHNYAYPEKSEDSLNRRKIPHKRGKRQCKTNKHKGQKHKEVGEGHDDQKTPGNEIVSGSSKVAVTSKTKLVQSLYTKLMDEVINHAVADLPSASGSKKGINKSTKLEVTKRSLSSIDHIHKQVSVKRKKQIKNLAQPHITREQSNLSIEMMLEEPCRTVNGSNGCTPSNKSKETGQSAPVLKQKHTLNDIITEKVDERVENVHPRAAAQDKSSSVKERSNNGNPGTFPENRKIQHRKNLPALRKCDTISVKCAFCHSTKESEDSGQMVHYSEGRPVAASHVEGLIIHSHKNCTEWAPNVYFEDNIAVNLEQELTRSRKIKCSLCGVKGAALGCYEKSCRKSFHVPCAKKLKECRWDTDHFVILCPHHASSKLPCELMMPQDRKRKCNPKWSQRPQVAATNRKKWNCSRSSEKVVLCCSALVATEKEAVSELAKSSGAVLSASWNPSVTHVIASTNEKGACKRTLKVMMGILEGKWILSIKWAQACNKAMKLVDETPYEITCDIHGVQNGPRLGRLRLLNEQPKLFAGFNFYFSGDFEPSYKGYLQDLVTAAGGTVLHRKPITKSQGIKTPSSSPSTVIIYNIELPANCDLRKVDMILDHRRSDAEALAIASGAKLGNNSWLLNSIAGHKLQDL
ncbi:unnamed protein product [Amaranthus hypochondriacus]